MQEVSYNYIMENICQCLTIVSTPFDVIYGYHYTMYDFSFTHNVVSYTHIFYIYLIKRINIHTCVCFNYME